MERGGQRKRARVRMRAQLLIQKRGERVKAGGEAVDMDHIASKRSTEVAAVAVDTMGEVARCNGKAGCL